MLSALRAIACINKTRGRSGRRERCGHADAWDMLRFDLTRGS